MGSADRILRRRPDSKAAYAVANNKDHVSNKVEGKIQQPRLLSDLHTLCVHTHAHAHTVHGHLWLHSKFEASLSYIRLSQLNKRAGSVRVGEKVQGRLTPKREQGVANQQEENKE